MTAIRKVLYALAFSCALGGSIPAPAAGAGTHQVSWDARSLKVDGKRLVVWAGEFHPFRLPDPAAWRDALQKMKAVGYNTVSIYFPWDFYTFAPGRYDFSGIRDIDRVLDEAARAGLYVIVRPGPYANAELTRGGFPGWLAAAHVKARTDDPAYLAAVDDWLSHIDPILARHQISRGGTVIAYQIENELLKTNPEQGRYMQHLHDRVRADGITVPLFSNDIGRNGKWVPESSHVPGTVPGPTDLYAFDTYPGGGCKPDGAVGKPNVAPDFGWYGAGGAKGGSSASPQTPGFTSEFGGGWFDYWGSSGLYDCIAQRIGSGYERVFYGTNIANGLTLQNVYMAVGGTSWGWLPGPIVYTSYDYGAGIDETLGLRDKAQTMKMLGQFVAVTGDRLAGMQKGGMLPDTNPLVKLYHNVNPDDGTELIVAMHNPSSATGDDAFSFDLKTVDGAYHIPQAGTLRVNGQDAKMLLANFTFGGQHLVYATSQLQTVLRGAAEDVALFYAPAGEDGEMVLRFSGAPKVSVIDGVVQQHFDRKTGDLRLNYRHQGLIRLQISGGGHKPVILLIATTEIGKTFWTTGNGTDAVLMRGGSLLRTAAVQGDMLELSGDTARKTKLEIWSATPFRRLSWNGAEMYFIRTASDGVLTMDIPAAQSVKLPDLMAGNWREHDGAPEAAQNFDDSDWPVADAQKTESTTSPPAGQPVLTADDYGFYNGDVWYRGAFRGGPSAKKISLRYGGGGSGMIQLWLDGKFVGENDLPAGKARPETVGNAAFTLPPAAQMPGPHVLSVMVRDNSHNWDLDADDAYKEGRGIISAALGRTERATVPVHWKIHGLNPAQADTVRGPLNNGGLYGESHGYTLPDFDDANWRKVQSDTQALTPGTRWLRTHFRLNLPKGDVRLGLSIGDKAMLHSTGTYRVLIFVNGWNVGQYIAGVGPQWRFVLPAGILNAAGENTLALAVSSAGNARLSPVRLEVLRNNRGGY